MEVKRDEGINIGTNPFYQPSNSTYGSTWQATQNNAANPVKMAEIPLYSDVVSIFQILQFFVFTICNSLKLIIYHHDFIGNT